MTVMVEIDHLSKSFGDFRAVTLQAPLWSSGFRPFFLLGASYGPLAAALWMLVPLPSIWHAHEMVYGFATAIVRATASISASRVNGLGNIGTPAWSRSRALISRSL